MISTVTLRSVLFVLLSLTLVSANVQAKPENGKKFKDWTVVCEKLPTSGEEVCNIFQNVTNEKQKIVLQVAIGYLPNVEKPQALLTMPLGVLLEPGLEFKGGSAKAIRLPFKVCVTNGCVAMTMLDDEIIKGMKAGNQGSVKIAVAKEKIIAIPISLKGFTAAFNSLK
ncbi:MAG: invasion associated locus B family protein [gamma proteobacterium symbiont of Taylorina sp.]|nr:invasion associated locus B family protein [gamma proteobacterium symbiont of Taylorina sp.]